MTEVTMATRSSLSTGADWVAKATVLSRTSTTQAEADVFGMIAMVCGPGLVVALLLATYGVDMIAGFF
jgi:hypothetical protein